MGDVGDAEGFPGDVGALGQGAVEHAERALGLGREALDGERLRLGGLALEEAGLAEGGAEARRMEEELLEDAGPACAAGRQQAARRLGEIHQDRGGFGQHQPSALRLGVDQHRHLAVRVKGEEVRRLLLALADVDAVERVGEPQFFQRDGYLDAVRGGEGVEVEHGVASAARI